MKKDKWYSSEISNRSELTYGFRTSAVPGCDVIECVWRKNPHPIGMIWYRLVGKSVIEILGCYVPDHYRRLGVMTYMHEMIIASYPKVKTIITAEGTSCGKPWLISAGFKQNPSDGWRLEIKRDKK